MNQYRCETCKKYKWNGCIALAKDTSLISVVGCASHSSIHISDDECIWMTTEEEERRIRKSERDSVLDNLNKRIAEYIPIYTDYERREAILNVLSIIDEIRYEGKPPEVEG